MRVVLYEGPGAAPLAGERREELMLALLEAGQGFARPAAGGSVSPLDDEAVVVLGEFEEGAAPSVEAAAGAPAVEVETIGADAVEDVVARVVRHDAATEEAGAGNGSRRTPGARRSTEGLDALVPRDRLQALHELHAVPVLLPVRRVRRRRERADRGAQRGEVQDQLPGVLARVPGGRDPLPEVRQGPDQRRRRARGGRRDRGDEGRHLGAPRRRHLRLAAAAAATMRRSASRPSATSRAPCSSASVASRS